MSWKKTTLSIKMNFMLKSGNDVSDSNTVCTNDDAQRDICPKSRKKELWVFYKYIVTINYKSVFQVCLDM